MNAVGTILDYCKTDATYFCRGVLGFTPWAKQRDILRSVRKHRRTLVISGHGVGKTQIAGAIICEWMSTRPQARVICTATTYPQVREVLWEKTRALYHAAKMPLGGRMLDAAWTIGPEWMAVAKTADDPTALQGIHGPAVLIVVDEGEGVPASNIEALSSLLSSDGSRMVAFTNPTSTQSWCYEAAQRPDVWHTINVSCLEHPNVVEGREVVPNAVTRQWVEEVRAQHGEDSDYWLSRVLGQFPKGGSKQIVTADAMREIEDGIGPEEQPRAGLDVARFGGDRTVLSIFDERRRLVAVESWAGSDLMASTGRAVEVSRRYGARLRVDVCGIGSGVVDRLREMRVDVDAVDFGEKARGDWPHLVSRGTAFLNRRAEMHWVFRELVRRKEIGIPKKFRETIADLLVPCFDYKSDGTIYVEDKEKIRARTGRSPDFGDSVLIAMSNGKRGRF